jgi:hypothetical protein
MMKRFFFFCVVLAMYAACNDEKKYSNDKADTRQHSNQTNDASGAKGTVSNDTTSTINNSAYNTDSMSGKGTTYDTSAKR